MAQISITTTTDQDAAAQRLFIRDFTKPAGETIGQWVTRQLTAVLDGWVNQINSEREISKAQAYKLATPEDKLAVDTILAKYGAV